ncbi:hypothetical protein BGZ63DRAFT_390893 [Mariannaea sp. PMI_226]|nr:hypothetical protein BGZ63DRAFT_390893 [Mariannaea sp. PMI_226]
MAQYIVDPTLCPGPWDEVRMRAMMWPPTSTKPSGSISWGGGGGRGRGWILDSPLTSLPHPLIQNIFVVGVMPLSSPLLPFLLFLLFLLLHPFLLSLLPLLLACSYIWAFSHGGELFYGIVNRLSGVPFQALVLLQCQQVFHC